MARSGHKGAIVGAFVAHRLEMRESPAWRALPDNGRRILDKLELEHMRHGGAENGNLICTYSDFHRAGIRRASVALAIRQCIELGFLAVTKAGYRTAAEFREPSVYRLTYVHGKRRTPDPTDDWEKITTDVDAAAGLERAQTARNYIRQTKRPPNGCGDGLPASCAPQAAPPPPPEI